MTSSREPRNSGAGARAKTSAKKMPEKSLRTRWGSSECSANGLPRKKVKRQAPKSPAHVIRKPQRRKPGIPKGPDVLVPNWRGKQQATWSIKPYRQAGARHVGRQPTETTSDARGDDARCSSPLPSIFEKGCTAWPHLSRDTAGRRRIHVTQTGDGRLCDRRNIFVFGERSYEYRS